MRWIRSAGDSMEVHTDRPGYLGDSACHTAYAKSLSTPEPLEISSMCSAPICSASAPIRASHHCRAYCGLAMGCSGVTACRAEGAMTPRPTVLPGAAGASLRVKYRPVSTPQQIGRAHV